MGKVGNTGSQKLDFEIEINSPEDLEMLQSFVQQFQGGAGGQQQFGLPPARGVDALQSSRASGIDCGCGTSSSRRAGLGGAEDNVDLKGLNAATQEAVQGALDSAETPEAKANIEKLVKSEGFSQLSDEHRQAALDALQKNPDDPKLAEDVIKLVGDPNFRNLNDATKSKVLGGFADLEPEARADVAKQVTQKSFSELNPATQAQAIDALSAEGNDKRFASDLAQLLGSDTFKNASEATKEQLIDTFGQNNQNGNGRASAALKAGEKGFGELSKEEQHQAIDETVANTEASKPGDDEKVYPKTEGYRDGVAGPDSVLGKGGGGALPTNSYAGLGENKKEILGALDKAGASEEEKALILAVAMQETTTMESSSGDKSKSGDADNVSALNLNVDMLKDLGVEDVHGLDGQSRLGETATHLLKGFREWGVDKTLAYVRGGSTAFNDGESYGAKDYAAGIGQIADQIIKGDHFTDDVRVERQTQYMG